MNSKTIKEVTDGLSELIYSTLTSIQMVQYHLGSDPNMMDDELVTVEKRYTELMRIRKEFEISCSLAIIKEK